MVNFCIELTVFNPSDCENQTIVLRFKNHSIVDVKILECVFEKVPVLGVVLIPNNK